MTEISNIINVCRYDKIVGSKVFFDNKSIEGMYAKKSEAAKCLG